MAGATSNDPFAQIIGQELAALTALTQNDTRAASARLNEAATLVDAMLAGAGRERLRYQLTTIPECSRFVLEMIPHQIEALKLASTGDLPRALVLLHGHASVLWRIATFLQDIKTSTGSEPLATKPVDDVPDDSVDPIIDQLDRFLDGEGKSLIVEAGTSGRRVWFHRQGDQLVLDFPVAPLTQAERRRALAFFQRVGVDLRDWDDVAVKDDTFSFMLDLGLNLTRSAHICMGLFREVLERAGVDDIRITAE